MTLDEPDEDVDVHELQRHRNGDETAVLLLHFGGGHQALAIDVDAGGQLLDVEEIGDQQDLQMAEGMVEYWLDQNPGGVLGGAPESSGLLSKLGGLFGGGDGA